MLEVTAVVRETRERSVTQKDGFGWGIRFISTSTGDIYKVFQGSSYANGTTTATHSFRRPVEFGEPAGNRTVDILFNPISGKVSTRKIITVAPKASRSYVGDIIVNTQGLITQRMEDNIVGYWHFDEGTGTSTYDASSNDNTGTVSGATWQSGSSCRAGDCLSFDGTAGPNVNLGMPSKLTSITNGDFTISVWIKTSDTGSRGAIFGSCCDTYPAVNFEINAGGNGRMRYWHNDNTATDSWYGDKTGLNDGNWHYVVMVRDRTNSKGRIYVDGILDKENSITALSNGSIANNVRIGTDNRLSADITNNGQIDEVRIYNRALTATEISNRYDDLK